METKIKDLTIQELRDLISSVVKETMEEVIEDMVALSSQNYLHSIEDAREDYREGRVKQLEELFDV